MPDAPPAAAPPAAAPTPPAAAPTAPTATPAPPTERPVGDLAGSDAWSALDALGRDEETPAPPTPQRQRGPDGKFKVEKTPDPPKPAEKPTPKPAETIPPKTEDTPVKAGELRKAYDQSKQEVAKLTTELTELKKKVATPQDDPEKKQLSETVTSLKKRLDEYENELRFTNFEKSQEYKDKYETPYVKAYMAGRQRAAGLKIIERKDDSDPSAPVIQAARKGTAEDFDTIMAISDDDAAAQKAVELFGQQAPLVLYHRERATEANGTRLEAIKEYREKGTTWEKERSETTSKQRKVAEDRVNQIQQAGIERFPGYFKEDAADPKASELLKVGQHMMNRLLAGGAPLADGETQWSENEIATEVAALRNKGIAFNRVAYQLNAARKKIKELEKALEGYDKSEPGAGEGAPPAAPDADGDSWEKRLEKKAH